MSDSLFPYYERELGIIRHLARDFAKQYPAAAGRLLLEANRSGDPHIERLIESFALLCGRIHRKLDDEFPELTNALLGVLYPHYLAPAPSMAVVQFDLDPTRGKLPKGCRIESGSRVQSSPVGGLPCRFRTTYPVTLWPLVIEQAVLQRPPLPKGYRPPPRTMSALRLEFKTVSQMRASQLQLDHLRLYLSADRSVVAELYELIFNHTTRVEFRLLDGDNAGKVIALSPQDALKQVGFDRDQGMVPYSPRSFLGYRLLVEFFAFPEKFHFLDLSGWKQAIAAGAHQRVEVVLYFDRRIESLEQWVEADVFKLGATPIVNLYEQVAEPIDLNHTTHEYRVVPNVTQQMGMEVWSVDTVISTDPTTGGTTEYQPFYSLQHGDRASETFWYASRRPSSRVNDRGSEMWLSLVNLKFTPSIPAAETLLVRCTCTNRDLPVALQQAGSRLSFDLETPAPLSKVHCLRVPTTPLRPALRRGAYWGLVSHLNLNHLSLTDEEDGCRALQEILRLYDFADPAAGQAELAAINRQIVEGILRVESRRTVGRVQDERGSGFCRGTRVRITFDEEKYIGTGVYLFASVLERFLGLYSNINSFSQLEAASHQREGVIKLWPPRTADRQLM